MIFYTMPAIDGYAAAIALPLGWSAIVVCFRSPLFQCVLLSFLCALPPLDALGMSAVLGLLAMRSHAPQWSGSGDMSCEPLHTEQHPEEERSANRLDWIALWRSLATLSSCWAILAVDTPLFPPSLRKCNDIDCLGLMDAGSGAFVLFNAVAGSRGIANNAHSGQTLAIRGYPWQTKMKRLRRAWGKPLSLAIARLVATRATGYSVPDEEYGRHWNFFFTLSFATHTSRALQQCFTAEHAGVAVLLLHQLALLANGRAGTEWGLADERGRDIISMNKEGIVSLPGYIGLHLLGNALASKLTATVRKQTRPEHAAIACILLSFIGLIFVSNAVQPPSRRIANAAYVAWVVSINCLGIATCMHVCKMSSIRLVIGAVKALDENLLPVFLLANLLTGAVNMQADLAAISYAQAAVLLGLYMGAIIAFAYALSTHKLRL